MKRFLSLLVLCTGFSSIGLAQNCFAPDLSDLEIMCNYEDPFNLAEAALPYTGTWTVEPIGGNVFVYNDYLYYTGAHAGQYNLKFLADNAPPTCPSELNFAAEVITTAYVWPVPTYICEGDTYFIGDVPLTTEDLHDVYLPGVHCDSLVTVFLLYYDECPPEGQSENSGPSTVGSTSTDDSPGTVSDPITDDGVIPVEDEIDLVEEPEQEDGQPLDPIETGGTLFSEEELVFPTAFSPDNSGFNDTFGMVGAADLSEYSIRIFSRWGNEVYTSTEVQQKWNGENNGVPVPAGVYYYCVNALTLGRKELSYQGSITLLR